MMKSSFTSNHSASGLQKRKQLHQQGYRDYASLKKPKPNAAVQRGERVDSPQPPLKKPLLKWPISVEAQFNGRRQKQADSGKDLRSPAPGKFDAKTPVTRELKTLQQFQPAQKPQFNHVVFPPPLKARKQKRTNVESNLQPQPCKKVKTKTLAEQSQKAGDQLSSSASRPESNQDIKPETVFQPKKRKLLIHGGDREHSAYKKTISRPAAQQAHTVEHIQQKEAKSERDVVPADPSNFRRQLKRKIRMLQRSNRDMVHHTMT